MNPQAENMINYSCSNAIKAQKISNGMFHTVTLPKNHHKIEPESLVESGSIFWIFLREIVNFLPFEIF